MQHKPQGSGVKQGALSRTLIWQLTNFPCFQKANGYKDRDLYRGLKPILQRDLGFSDDYTTASKKL